MVVWSDLLLRVFAQRGLLQAALRDAAASGELRGAPDLIGIQKPESARGDRSGSGVRMCCRARNDRW